MTAASFHSRLTRSPIAHDAQAGADVARQFAELGAPLAELLGATAGCSPFLAMAMQREEAWLREALLSPPEEVLTRTLDAIDAATIETVAADLRRAKLRVALLAALADLGGVWPLEVVTGALTDLADKAVDKALKLSVAEEIRRGKLPGATAEDAATGAGMVVLAMGKMGARELNYSSDIDLICLFDETRYPGEADEARAVFIRVTRKICSLISDRTADGYVFRTDLRLRPDASSTPVCLSMAAAESYYESVGRTWERAAYIKARPCAGDLEAGEKFLRGLVPFVWRKHLDFAAIQDAHDMRLRIRDHRGLHGPVQIAGHNMKLGVGGIREIEFFTQTRQLIAGGRDPSLRDRGTEAALAALAKQGWIPDDVAADLTQLYRAHREVEHRLQMVNDSQTQDMPTSADGIARIAHFMGEADPKAFCEALRARLERTDHLTEGFFAPTQAEAGPELSPSAAEIVKGWSSYPALRSQRAVDLFLRLRPGILKRLQKAGGSDEALLAFDGFLRGLPAGVQIFALFEANPQLIDLIVDIAATSPSLALYLSRNAGVLDAVIGGSFFAPWPGPAALEADLSAQIAPLEDYERKLDTARRWMKEWHFRTGVHHLRGLIDAFEAGRHYSDLATAVIRALWPEVVAEFARKHGPPPGRGACVLGMGSLGAERLNAGSDLDLIVIYDAPDSDYSTGRKPLAVRPYFARFTQALVTALTAPMAEGRLYEVDMRLRPSGRQGPVATSLTAFSAYQRDEAWTWEHLALTRARPLAGGRDLCDDVEALRRAILTEKAEGESVLADVADMRRRLAAAKPAGATLEAKNGPGRLMDIELLAQTCALRSADPAHEVLAQVSAGVNAGFLSQSEQRALQDAYRFCWQLQAGGRLLTERELAAEALSEGGRAFVLRQTAQPDFTALEARLDAVVAAVLPVMDRVFGPEGQRSDDDLDG
jgi:[glutamine synthetase] adenylyltransferase / [glutamine synthetase]-adenylyl-L-tyrosine phosphorylase